MGDLVVAAAQGAGRRGHEGARRVFHRETAHRAQGHHPRPRGARTEEKQIEGVDAVRRDVSQGLLARARRETCSPCHATGMGVVAHRVSSYALRLEQRANWVHEREWRVGSDLVFDLARCIVLVPTFDQADTFRKALDARGLSVMGTRCSSAAASLRSRSSFSIEDQGLALATRRGIVEDCEEPVPAVGDHDPLRRVLLS